MIIDAVYLTKAAWKVYEAEQARIRLAYESFVAERNAKGRPLSDLEKLQNRPPSAVSRKELGDSLALALIRRNL